MRAWRWQGRTDVSSGLSPDDQLFARRRGAGGRDAIREPSPRRDRRARRRNGAATVPRSGRVRTNCRWQWSSDVSPRPVRTLQPSGELDLASRQHDRSHSEGGAILERPRASGRFERAWRRGRAAVDVRRQPRPDDRDRAGKPRRSLPVHGIVDALTGRARRMTSGTKSRWPFLSSDGLRLAVVRERHLCPGVYRAGDVEVLRVGSAGRARTLVRGDCSTSYSPRGWTTNRQLVAFRMRRATGEQRPYRVTS